MKYIKHAYAQRYQGSKNDSRLVAFSFGVSIVIHLTFIGGLLLMPERMPRSRFSSSVVNVSLVSMPGKAPAEGSGTQPVVKPKKKATKKLPKAKISKIAPPPQKPVVAAPKPEKAISLAPKPKKKTSLKKKTINRPKMIESAIKEVQQKVDDSKTESVKSAIDRLKKQVKEAEETAPPLPPARIGKRSGTGTGMGRGTGGGGPRTLEAIKIYQAEIQYQIQKNWAFPQQLAGDSTELEAVLAIKILRNGEIEDIWFDRKSGNDYLDESAQKAIMKSNPLPPLPNEYIGPYYKIGLIFGPKGLK